MTTALAVIIFINLPSPLRWWGAVIGALSLILLWLLYRSTVKPVIVARRGLDLLAAQDFNNRLIKVGEPGADKIVTLFNDLMT
ncbi:MAG: PAS domain-containing sensor histidine kinase, partial [Muribaculaceae bacterium]|nr:PAS domain-containing sensor histidine kinase [Muribaculaceae bacterium]